MYLPIISKCLPFFLKEVNTLFPSLYNVTTGYTQSVSPDKGDFPKMTPVVQQDRIMNFKRVLTKVFQIHAKQTKRNLQASGTTGR